MKAQRCVVCGRPAADAHHPTGRGLDRELVAPHCHDHHELCHDDWWTAGVAAKRSRDRDVEDRPPTFLDGLYLRLRRLAMWVGRLAEAGVFLPVSALLAAALARWATRLADCLSALDAQRPDWRSTPGLAEDA